MFNRLRLVLLVAAFALVALPAAANAAAPGNDDFANATPLSLGTDISGTNLDATGEANEPQPSAGNIRENGCSTYTEAPHCTASVWYTFQVPSDGNYTVETCDEGTDIDTVLAVWSGATIDSLSQVGANDDGTNCAGDGQGYGSRVTFAATSGVQYHVEVNGYAADRGSFYLRAYPEGSPPPAGAPDTRIGHYSSFAAARYQLQGYMQSGPRHTASFDFSATQSGASYQCSLDGAAFSACSSPVSYDGLSGSHTFAVRATVGGQTDPTPAVQRFTIDDEAPDTVFSQAPTSPTSDLAPTWTASSSEQPLGFLCSVDGTTSQGCDGSFQLDSPCNASHEVRAAAIDGAYNEDPTPAISDVTENGGSACAAPTLGSLSPYSQSGTEEDINISLNTGGYGGTVHVDYGTTSGYGQSIDVPVGTGDPGSHAPLYFLQPSTLYHYRVTFTTPAGTADSGDQTFTTEGASGPLPGVTIGAPVVVGNHAAAIPLTLNGQGEEVEYGVLIDSSGTASATSPYVEADTTAQISDSPLARTIDVTDLEPGTYHVRGFVLNAGPEGTMSDEITFTVPAQPAPPSGSPPPPQPPVSHFTLKRSALKVGKITRKSRFLTLTIKGLPPRAVVDAQLSGNLRAAALKKLAHGRARANLSGVVKLKVRLSAKTRKLLRGHRVKSLTLRVRVTPVGQKTTQITLHPKLKKR
jgi:hypothetical protein